MSDERAFSEVSDNLPAAVGAAVLRAAFDASPRALLLMAADPPKFTMVAVNPAHAQAFATTPEALIGSGVFEVFGPAPTAEAAEFMEAIRGSLERVVETLEPDQMAVRPYAVPGADGTSQERYWSAANVPILSAGGALTHILSAVQDVTGEVFERRSETARSLLMREVDHRARNALAVVQSVVRLTTAETPDEFRKVVSGRVEALARAQTSLAARRWEGAALRELIDGELSDLAERGRYSLAGPHLLLPAHHVQAMSMIIHELATNAAKYGSLAAADGSLTIAWSVGNDERLRLRWSEETRQRTIEPPERRGFGARLIGDLCRQLGGTIAYDWRPQGLVAELDLKPD